jgi:hypothetical protein
MEHAQIENWFKPFDASAANGGSPSLPTFPTVYRVRDPGNLPARFATTPIEASVQPAYGVPAAQPTPLDKEVTRGDSLSSGAYQHGNRSSDCYAADQTRYGLTGWDGRSDDGAPNVDEPHPADMERQRRGSTLSQDLARQVSSKLDVPVAVSALLIDTSVASRAFGATGWPLQALPPQVNPEPGLAASEVAHEATSQLAGSSSLGGATSTFGAYRNDPKSAFAPSPSVLASNSSWPSTIRIHAQWSANSVDVWLGMDGTATQILGQARLIISELKDHLGGLGRRLGRVTCNGSVLFDPEQSSAWQDTNSFAVTVAQQARQRQTDLPTRDANTLAIEGSQTRIPGYSHINLSEAS